MIPHKPVEKITFLTFMILRTNPLRTKKSKFLTFIILVVYWCEKLLKIVTKSIISQRPHISESIVIPDQKRLYEIYNIAKQYTPVRRFDSEIQLAKREKTEPNLTQNRSYLMNHISQRQMLYLIRSVLIRPTTLQNIVHTSVTQFKRYEFSNGKISIKKSSVIVTKSTLSRQPYIVETNVIYHWKDLDKCYKLKSIRYGVRRFYQKLFKVKSQKFSRKNRSTLKNRRDETISPIMLVSSHNS